jgi:hypothetical protein
LELDNQLCLRKPLLGPLKLAAKTLVLIGEWILGRFAPSLVIGKR